MTVSDREALARFEALPWPDQSREEWRHTDIRALDLAAFTLGEGGSTNSTVGPALEGPAGELGDWLGSGGVSDYEEKLVALNAAYADVRFVRVPRGMHVEAPVEATHMIRPGGGFFPRSIIVVEEGASLTYVDRYAAPEGGADALCIAAVEIYAGQGAIVDYVSLQDWPQNVWHFGIQRAIVGRDATVRSLAATLGGKLSRSVVQCVLDGQGARAEMLGVYFGDHDQHIDNRTLQLHRAPDTSSELYYKGALKGSSRAIYSGLVDIEKDAKRSDAQQANRNLLLSPNASADPSPFLEIKTSEVVRATHGVSVGKPDAEVLFYLLSRGLEPAEAERLYVTGFFQELIDRVRVPGIRETLTAAVDAELELEE
jgi:Fe-S cluster assembly protein SufD